MNTKKQIKLVIALLVCCMVFALGISIYTYIDYKNREPERMLKAKESISEYEELLKTAPAEIEKQKEVMLEQIDRLGLTLEESASETILVDREELEQMLNEGKINFDRTPGKEVLAEADIQTFYVSMTNYLYAGNLKEAGKLSNRIQAKYDLNQVEDQRFQNLILDINYLYGTQTLPSQNIADFIRTPEVLSYLFMQQPFEGQYEIIKEKRSPVIKNYKTFNVISVTEVNPRHYGADFYFSGVYRFKGYEFKFSTSDGIFMIYTVSDQNEHMHILATGSESNASTYEELYNLYYEGS